MKKLSLFILVMAMVFPFTSQAYTIDQLVENGGQAIENLKMCYKANSVYAKSHGCRLVKVSDTQLNIENLYLGKVTSYGSSNVSLDLTFELVQKASSDFSGSGDGITSDGSYLRIKYTTQSTAGWKMEAGYITGNSRQGYVYNFITYDYTYLKIGDNGNGTYTLTSTTPILYADPSVSTVPYYDIFDELKIETILPNATASHSVQKYTFSQNRNSISNCKTSGSPREEEYDLIFDIDRKNETFKALNLGNNGYAVDNLLSYNNLTGTFNKANHTIRLDANQYAYNSDLWGSTGQNGTSGGQTTSFKNFYYYYLTNFTYASSPTFGAPLDGTYTEEDAHHDAGSTAWVTNGGKRETYESWEITLPSYTFYTSKDANNKWDFSNYSYDNTQISVKTLDCTLDVELELSELRWHGEDGVYMVGNIKTNKNDHYVDHYDVMIVKGKWDHIEQTHAVHGTFQPCTDNGHVNARVLCDHRDDATNGWGKQNAISLSSNEYQNEGTGEHDYQFAKLITPEELGAENLGANGEVENSEYTAFIRAIYKPETGLTPTFHDMKYLTVTTPTGVSDLSAEGMAPTVVAVPEGIAISSTDRTVQVVNTLGAVLYQGPATTVSVAPGMYIVRAGSFSTKVLVK